MKELHKVSSRSNIVLGLCYLQKPSLNKLSQKKDRCIVILKWWKQTVKFFFFQTEILLFEKNPSICVTLKNQISWLNETLSKYGIGINLKT